MSSPSKRNQSSSDAQNKYEIEPQPMLEKTPFKSLCSFHPTINKIEQYYNNFLQEHIYFAEKDNTLKQFDFLSQEQKNKIIKKIQLIIQVLKDEFEIRDYNFKTIDNIRAAFRQFKLDLELRISSGKNKKNRQSKNSKKQNQLATEQPNNEQSKQQIKPRTNCQKFCQSLIHSGKRFLQGFLIALMLIPQYNLFQSWSGSQIALLVLFAILLIFKICQISDLFREKWREISEQQQGKKQGKKRNQQQESELSSNGLQRSRSRSEGKSRRVGNVEDDKIQS